ncbi:MAG TPA: hypothetical protein VN843_07995, partial [Anaerolineales bacterium]|nr:hypothetical protein [Anaerolineales bacterium]
IEAWTWLKKLVNENRDAIALQNEIASDAKEWEDHKRDESYLYSGARLANAGEQLGAKRIVLSDLSQMFVDSSQEAEKAERQQEELRRQKEVDDAQKLAEAETKRAEVEKQRAEEQTRSAANLRKRSIYLSVALVIALIAVWRTNVIGSSAANESRKGLIDAVKKQAFDNENFRKVYEEAGFAYQFSVKQAEVEALEASDNPVVQDQAANIRQYLLPNMQLLGQPLATDEKYQNTDGTYDLQKRLGDMQTGEESQLEPTASFARADSFFSQQRWLGVGSVFLAVSLFWLALAEVSSERLRGWQFTLGLVTFLVGVLWFIGVELVFLYMRRGG